MLRAVPYPESIDRTAPVTQGEQLPEFAVPNDATRSWAEAPIGVKIISRWGWLSLAEMIMAPDHVP